MGYRRRFDIIADMLSVASGRAKKTQIMYQANLSYSLLTKYLGEIRRSSLIVYERKGHCYTLTEKGRIFLELYREFVQRRGYVEKQVKDVNQKRQVLEQLCPEKRA